MVGDGERIALKTLVVNQRFGLYDVYIGRDQGPDGYFGNPFRLVHYNSNSERKRVLIQYSKYFNARVGSDVEFAQRVLNLRGLRLGCFCKPLPCHGDVIAAWCESAVCGGCGGLPTLAVDPHDLDEREVSQVILLCGECGK